MVSEHALPSAPKSADRIDGAMIAGGDMMGGSAVGIDCVDDVGRRQLQESGDSGDC
jgi:hypothetical protein